MGCCYHNVHCLGQTNLWNRTPRNTCFSEAGELADPAENDLFLLYSLHVITFYIIAFDQRLIRL